MGKASDFSITKDGVLTNYRGKDKNVIIPDAVKIVGEDAFYRNGKGIISIEIPDSVTSIGECAFRGCSALVSISVPDSVVDFGCDAFTSCKRLANESGFAISNNKLLRYFGAEASVCIPEGVTTICDYAFHKSKIEKVILPDSVTEIGKGAFWGCTKLTEINIPERVNKIKNIAFLDCKKLADQQGFVIVQNYLFQYFGKKNTVEIPKGVNTIGVRAFGANIKQVSFPNSVTAINPLAFDYTNMQDIHCSDPIWDLLWGSVKDSTPDEKERFCICFTKNACNTASLHEDVKGYISRKRESIIHRAIADNDTKAVSALLQTLKPFTLEQVDGLLKTCAGSPEITALLLEYKKAHYTQEKIEVAEKRRIEKALTDTQTTAGLKKLWTTKTLDDGSLMLTSYKGEDTVVAVPSSIGEYPVTIIGEKCFSPYAMRISKNMQDVRERITSVVIPEGVRIIGDRAFQNCKKLKSVSVANSVTEIGCEAFLDCSELEKIKIPHAKRIHARAFKYCEKLSEISVEDDETEVADDAFDCCKKLADEQGLIIVDGIVFSYCGTGDRVRIPEGVMVIGNGAFSQCGKLSNVHIADSVVYIGWSAFEWCTELTEITIPAGVQQINSKTFQYCVNLSRIKLPESVVAVESDAFAGCSNLTIQAPAGSYAETYAKENNISFVAE